MFHFGAHLFKIKSINTIHHETNFGWHITWDQAQCKISYETLGSNEHMILALAGQFKQLSHEPEKFT